MLMTQGPDAHDTGPSARNAGLLMLMMLAPLLLV